MTADLSEQRLRLRPGVRVGRLLRSGDDIVCYVKDPRSADYLRVGPRESFLLERLDGSRTLAEISEEYDREFHRRLSDAHWRQLLGALHGRDLIASGPDSGSGYDDRAGADGGSVAVPVAASPRSRRSLLRVAVPLVNPDRFLGVLVGRLGLLFHPAVVGAALLAVVLTELLVLTHLGTLWHDLRHNASRGLYVPAAMAVSWIVVALHELAHGLVCKRYGGNVPEIGVIWRFPLVAPYCRVDDVVVFRRRRHAVYTALAGVFTGLVAITPFAVVWLLAPQGGPARGLAASVLLLGSVTAVVNLAPFLQLDGYFAVNHALGMADLRRGSQRFWRLVFTGRVAQLRRYSGRDRLAYGGYGLASLCFVAAAVGVGLWHLS